MTKATQMSEPDYRAYLKEHCCSDEEIERIVLRIYGRYQNEN
jgi:hypothetical protein